jgi:hypothetical protein
MSPAERGVLEACRCRPASWPQTATTTSPLRSEPTWAARYIVVCDRYVASSYVLQRLDDVPIEFVEAINAATDVPDLAVILTAEPNMTRTATERTHCPISTISIWFSFHEAMLGVANYLDGAAPPRQMLHPTAAANPPPVRIIPITPETDLNAPPPAPRRIDRMPDDHIPVRPAHLKRALGRRGGPSSNGRMWISLRRMAATHSRRYPERLARRQSHGPELPDGATRSVHPAVHRRRPTMQPHRGRSVVRRRNLRQGLRAVDLPVPVPGDRPLRAGYRHLGLGEARSDGHPPVGHPGPGARPAASARSLLGSTGRTNRRAPWRSDFARRRTRHPSATRGPPPQEASIDGLALGLMCRPPEVGFRPRSAVHGVVHELTCTGALTAPDGASRTCVGPCRVLPTGELATFKSVASCYESSNPSPVTPCESGP